MDFLDNSPLWSHQREALLRVQKRVERGINFFALFFEQGTGKTLTAIYIIRYLWRRSERPMMTLILCPLIVVRNWQREIEKYAPKSMSDHVVILSGSRAKRLKALNWGLNNDKKIYITNIDTLNTKFWRENLSQEPWEIMTLDESQKIKTHNSKRSQALRPVADKIPYNFILSGTPILNSALDIWGQFRVLSRDILDPNYYIFRKRYFEDRNSGMPKQSYFPNWVPKPETYESLQTIIEAHSMRVTKDEVLDLPELVRQRVFVSMTREQERIYKEMMNYFIAYLEDSASVAPIALTKLLRLLQICCGLFREEQSDNIKRIPTGKLSALHELLGDIAPQHKVIVWANFIENYKDIELVCGELGLDFRIIRGGQGDDERQQAIDDFQTKESVRVMIANQSAGGVGINLTAASYMIYFSKNFSLNDDLQSEARAHRGGSEIHKSITRIDIITEGTVEEEVTEALYGKKKIAELLLDIKRKNGIPNREQQLDGAVA